MSLISWLVFLLKKIIQLLTRSSLIYFQQSRHLYHSTEFVLQNNKLPSAKKKIKKNDLGVGLFWMLALSIWSTPFPYGVEEN
jgi:hypothetical protein